MRYGFESCTVYHFDLASICAAANTRKGTRIKLEATRNAKRTAKSMRGEGDQFGQL